MTFKLERNKNLVDARSILYTVVIPNENTGVLFAFSKENICCNEVKFSVTGDCAVTPEQVLSQLYLDKTFCKICHFSFQLQCRVYQIRTCLNIKTVALLKSILI